MHRRVGKSVAEHLPDLLLTVGNLATEIGNGAVENGFPSAQIIPFADTEVATAAIGSIVRPGDTVLVKGSRALAMEKIVEAIRTASEDEQ